MIRLVKPAVGEVYGDLKSLLEEGFLVQGRRVERFEELVAAYVGRAHGIAVNSGTSAIHCALMSLGIGEGDEVILPDFTFPATANAAVCAGAQPVLADIDPRTFNISVESVEAAVTSATKAVMPVGLFGLAADMDRIEDVCRRHGLLLIEDSACALGASCLGRHCGSFGEASVISFHPRKIVTTGEGGMVLTDSEDAARTARTLRNHGIEVSEGTTRFVLAGYNMRMTEIEACLGIAQMARIDEMIDGRRRIASLYDRLLSEIAEVTVPYEPEGSVHTYQSYVIMVDEGIDRDMLIRSMKNEGVETTIGTYAIHVQPFYSDKLKHRAGAFPHSYRAFRHSLCLPIYASMGEKAVRQVVRSLRDCISRSIAGK